MPGALYICGGESGSGSRRDPRNDLDGCPNVLHHWPLPSEYVDRRDQCPVRVDADDPSRYRVDIEWLPKQAR